MCASHPELIKISFSELFNHMLSNLSVIDFCSFKSSLDAVPITPDLGLCDVKEIVESPSVSRSSLTSESESSKGMAFLVGTIFLAVLLTLSVSNHMS